jgi:hypothetical protein
MQCSVCGASTHIKNGFKVGITLRKHEGQYYCLKDYPGPIPLLYRHADVFYRTIDRMRTIVQAKKSKKHLKRKYGI